MQALTKPLCRSRVEPAFDVKWIGASNSILGALTTLSVTLKPNVDLLPGEQLLLSDLLGSSLASGNLFLQARMLTYADVC